MTTADKTKTKQRSTGPYLYDLGARRFVEITPALTIGRGSEDPVFAADGKLSREHLRFSMEDGHVYAEDLGSTNGSKLNGYRLSPRIATPLTDGDLIEAGNQRFYYTIKQDMPEDTNYAILLERRRAQLTSNRA